MAVWEFWKLRNSVIFYNGIFSIALWRREFGNQVFLQLVRVAEDKHLAIIQWLQTVAIFRYPLYISIF